jgi:N-formylglutamate amidohydrolase
MDGTSHIERSIPDILRCVEPGPSGVVPPVPVVFDSPHSGRVYPADFGHAVPMELLRRAEDAFVDELFATAPQHGVAFLAALFPRSYVDPNRHEWDIDVDMLADSWPHEVLASERCARGLGVVRRLLRAQLPVYDRRLTAAEVLARIERCHRPYHTTLKELLDAAHARFGAVWHVNCHSMRGTGRRGLDGHVARRADFVLGDRDGTTCDGAFTHFVRETLRGFGYSVVLNRPFKGAELVIRHGSPRTGRHSLQIEINRGLYMEDDRIEKSAGFEALRANLDQLIAAIAAYARAQAEERSDVDSAIL